MAYYIYVLRCKGDTLYTGITPDLRRRMRQHCGQLAGGECVSTAVSLPAAQNTPTATNRRHCSGCGKLSTILPQPGLNALSSS